MIDSSSKFVSPGIFNPVEWSAGKSTKKLGAQSREVSSSSYLNLRGQDPGAIIPEIPMGTLNYYSKLVLQTRSEAPKRWFRVDANRKEGDVIPIHATVVNQGAHPDLDPQAQSVLYKVSAPLTNADKSKAPYYAIFQSPEDGRLRHMELMFPAPGDSIEMVLPDPIRDAILRFVPMPSLDHLEEELFHPRRLSYGALVGKISLLKNTTPTDSPSKLELIVQGKNWRTPTIQVDTTQGVENTARELVKQFSKCNLRAFAGPNSKEVFVVFPYSMGGFEMLSVPNNLYLGLSLAETSHMKFDGLSVGQQKPIKIWCGDTVEAGFSDMMKLYNHPWSDKIGITYRVGPNGQPVTIQAEISEDNSRKLGTRHAHAQAIKERLTEEAMGRFRIEIETVKPPFKNIAKEDRQKYPRWARETIGVKVIPLNNTEILSISRHGVPMTQPISHDGELLGLVDLALKDLSRENDGDLTLLAYRSGKSLWRQKSPRLIGVTSMFIDKNPDDQDNLIEYIGQSEVPGMQQIMGGLIRNFDLPPIDFLGGSGFRMITQAGDVFAAGMRVTSTSAEMSLSFIRPYQLK